MWAAAIQARGTTVAARAGRSRQPRTKASTRCRRFTVPPLFPEAGALPSALSPDGHQNAGGSVRQGRFRSPVIQDDDQLLTVLRYAEANPLRAGLVEAGTDGGGAPGLPARVAPRAAERAGAGGGDDRPALWHSGLSAAHRPAPGNPAGGTAARQARKQLAK